MDSHEDSKSPFTGVVKALGLVFGDIGTSHIYTLGVIMALTSFPREDLRASVMGIVSTILWTLVTLVTVQYAWLAMGFSIRGEGGTVVLKEILVSKIKGARKIAIITFLTYLGVSLLLGDGALTPAISIISAVEGVRLIPHCEELSTLGVVGISSLIAIVLFAFQYKGTDKVSGLFGPVMVVWFAVLSVAGIFALGATPKFSGRRRRRTPSPFSRTTAGPGSGSFRKSSCAPPEPRRSTPTWGTWGATRSGGRGSSCSSPWR